MFSISEFVKHVGSELNIRGSHRRMSLPEVQDTGNLMNEFQGYDQSHEDFMSTSVRCRKTTDSAKLLAGVGYRRRSLRKALISGDVEPHERDRNQGFGSAFGMREVGRQLRGAEHVQPVQIAVHAQAGPGG